MTDPLESDSGPKNPSSVTETPSPVSGEATPSATSHGTPGELFFPAMGQGKMSQSQERLWGSLGHLLSLTGILTAGVGYIVGPLIPYFMKKGESPFVDEHSKETLNFSIVTVIAIFVSGLGAVTSAPILGCFAPLIPGLFVILNLIFCIQGASAARDGKAYRYPFNWRIIK